MGNMKTPTVIFSIVLGVCQGFQWSSKVQQVELLVQSKKNLNGLHVLNCGLLCRHCADDVKSEMLRFKDFWGYRAVRRAVKSAD
jgi:hypothetical protein